LTLNADGHYQIKSGDCTTERAESGVYVFYGGSIRFTILKLMGKQRGDGKEMNLLDTKERKRFYGSDGVGGVISPEFELLPIRWSGRIYFMAKDELSSFANAINLGLEPRGEVISEPYYGQFYLREGDEQKKVDGSPRLPEKWNSFLLTKPVVANVLETEGNEEARI
jgi:hypothetical protein